MSLPVTLDPGGLIPKFTWFLFRTVSRPCWSMSELSALSSMSSADSTCFIQIIDRNMVGSGGLSLARRQGISQCSSTVQLFSNVLSRASASDISLFCLEEYWGVGILLSHDSLKSIHAFMTISCLFQAVASCFKVQGRYCFQTLIVTLFYLFT